MGRNRGNPSVLDGRLSKPNIRTAIHYGTGQRAWRCCLPGTPHWNALDIGYGITPRDAYYAWVRCALSGPVVCRPYKKETA